MSEPRRVSLIEARSSDAGFRARVPGAGRPTPQPCADAPVPDRYAEGFAAGEVAAQAACAREIGALQALVAASAALQPEPSEELALMIATTVERLVSELVGQVAIDRAWLDDRIGRALACIAEADAARTLWLHPDDLPLIDRDAITLDIGTDPSLERGALRIDCSAGWIEDARSLHLDRLRAALGIEARS